MNHDPITQPKGDTPEHIETDAAIGRLTVEALTPTDGLKVCNVLVNANDLRRGLTEILRLKSVAHSNFANYESSAKLARELKQLADGLLLSVRAFHREAEHGTPSANAMAGMLNAADNIDAKLKQVGRS